MTKRIGVALALVFALAISQGLAWGAVTVSWTDGLGSHQQGLAFEPIDPGDLLYAYAENAWVGTLDITYTVRQVISFSFTGDYTGNGQAYPYIRLYQTVHNQTQYDWTDFHLSIPSGEADEFGWVQGVTTGWDINQGLTTVDYTMPQGGTPIHPGETFYDGVFIFDDYDATADLTVDKWPTPLPEVGSAAVLLSGLGGMIAFVKRRKA